MTDVILITILGYAFGVVWVDNLTTPEGLLSFMAPGPRMPEKIKHLGECMTCIAGQATFWTYLAWAIYQGDYNPLHHMTATFVAMLLSHITNRILP